MFDGAGEISNNVIVTIAEEKGGYTVTYKPDMEWLKDPARIYPITIDPTVRTSIERTDIKDGHVSQGFPTTNYQNAIYLKSGYGSSSLKNRSYMKFTLPELTSADTVIYADLQLALASTVTNTYEIDVHKVTSTWDSSTLTWNKQPTYDTNIIDDYINVNSTEDIYTFEITKLVKDWYTTGTNHGLMIKNKNESSGYTEFYSSDTSNQYESLRPVVSLIYVNNSGIEDYWSYHNQDLGRAGTGYVNDYNGNLVFIHDDVSSNGNRMPVNIYHVYNSNTHSTNTGYGKGWRLNLSQTITKATIDSVVYCVYTDEDGTIHYLEDIGNGTYEDEGGIDLTLTENLSSTTERYVIKDKEDNSLIFDSTGKLKKITDNNNNRIELIYTNNLLTSVKDGVDRAMTLTYLNGKLSSIADPAGRKINYTYTSDQLTAITYPDGKISKYYYDALFKAENIDGYTVNYIPTNTTPKKVQKIEESNIDGTQGDMITISYGKNATTFTDYENRKTIYQFNNQGNVVSIENEEGFAQYYKFIESGKNKNRISTSSKLQKTIMNLVRNHNFETSGYWNFSLLNGATGSGNYVTEDKYSASKSTKIIKTSETGQAVYQQTLALEKGKTYTFSGYLKAEGIATIGEKGAGFGIKYKDASGSEVQVYSSFVTGTKNWGRQEVTFTLPSDASEANVTLLLGVFGGVGTAYFDAMQLETGKVSNRYNMVENGDFSYGTALAPEFWSRVNCDANDQVVTMDNPQVIDDKVMKITGNGTTHKYMRQVINNPGKQGDTFVFSAWAKADSIPLREDRKMTLRFAFARTDGTYQNTDVTYNPHSNSWQYASGVAIADSDYTDVRIYGLYTNNVNTIAFDGFQLYKEEFGESYTYDENGNLISTTDLAKEKSTFNYNSSNDLIKALDLKGNEFRYAYDANHNLLEGISAENVKYAFTYDSYGNPLSSKIGEVGKIIKTTAAYTANGNYMSTMTDSSGNSVDYNWNETKGLLNTLADPKDKVTNYSYNNNTDELTSVSKQVGSNTITNSYTYNKDYLDSISHNGFSYHFTYDSLGNPISTKVGANSLVTNSYEPRTSKLTDTTYGNGQKIQLIYDELDREKSTQYNGETRYEYDYDGSGNLAYINDNINQVKTRYHYDLSDQLTKITDDKGNSTEFTLDANSDMTIMKEKIGGGFYQTNYVYDKDGRQTSVKVDGDSEKQVQYAYDSLGRLHNRTIHLTAKDFHTSYTYKDGQTDQTTSHLQEVDNNGVKINYQYDANGNIITIVDNGKNISYEYEELNQLTRENNQVLNKTIVYTYDLGGNITTKAEYAYTTGTLGTPQKTIPYSYEDTTWKDKLTSYDGKAITYDGIGNPLSYDGNHYSWEEGRNLTMVVGDQINASYKYNDEGIRTEKTVDGVTTTYHLVGDKVSYETNGTDTLYYSYDANDSLVAMKHNDDYYYYIRNGQGDITGILDENGTQVATYTYDTWGKLTSITGSLASTVGEKNPYRYRGYRYDSETGLYYLQSRYYNPEWGRFVNADSILGANCDMIAYNLFAYCSNNPVVSSDSSGNVIETIIDIASIGWSMSDLIKNPSWTNLGFLAWDVGATILPGIPGSYTYKGAKIVKGVSKLRKFTSGNFRHNLTRLIGKASKKMGKVEAHHILPQKFRNTFLKKGLKIDDPRFGTWVNTDAHRKWSYQYNKEWEKYLSRNRNASSKQILSFARQLAKKYKFSTHF